MNDTLPKRFVGGVCIKEGKVLLIHRINKERSLNQEYFMFPGRTVDDDESIEDALINEFKDFSVTVSLGDLLYSKEDEVDESEYYYLCKHLLGDPLLNVASEEKEIMAEGEQFYTPMWVSLSELDDIMIYPESLKTHLVDILEKTLYTENI